MSHEVAARFLADCMETETIGLHRPPPDVVRRVRTRCLSPGFMAGLVPAVDALVLYGTSMLIWYVYVGLLSPATVASYIAATGLGTFGAIVIQYLNGLYGPDHLGNLRRQLPRTLLCWGIAITLIVQLAFALKVTEEFSRVWLFSWLIAGAVGLTGLRILTARLMGHFARAGFVGERIAVYGAGSQGRMLLEHLRAESDDYLHLVGVFADAQDCADEGHAMAPRLVPDGTLGDLLTAAQKGYIDTVILAVPWTASERLWNLVQALEAVSVDVQLCPAPLGAKLPCHDVQRVASIPMLSLWTRPLRSWHGTAKWLEDKIIATGALLFFGPLMLIIAALIKLDSRGPVLFRQKRFGFNNEAIHVLKFRTMYADRQDVSGARRTIRGDSRVTRVGRFLRRTSLDELPQLLNVLKGDMSIVGPRPHAVAMKVGDRYYFEAVRGYAARHRVKPGITGWAQVNDLRGEIDTVRKAESRVVHDLHYVNHWSLFLDIWIILMTFKALISTRNAY